MCQARTFLSYVSAQLGCTWKQFWHCFVQNCNIVLTSWPAWPSCRENLHKGRVRCKLQDCIVRLFFIISFYFIWINYASLCNKSYFHYKSLIKASRLQIFGTYILFNFLSNCALKNFSIEINFLCILLFYEFLNMYFCFFILLFFIVFSLKFVAATFSSIT